MPRNEESRTFPSSQEGGRIGVPLDNPCPTDTRGLIRNGKNINDIKAEDPGYPPGSGPWSSARFRRVIIGFPPSGSGPDPPHPDLAIRGSSALSSAHPNYSDGTYHAPFDPSDVRANRLKAISLVTSSVDTWAIFASVAGVAITL